MNRVEDFKEFLKNLEFTKSLKPLKESFKNWGVAKRHNAALVHIAKGVAVVSMEITKDDLTPHAEDTKVLFGGAHFVCANMAGAYGTMTLLEPDEEPLLNHGACEYTEAFVIEEKLLLARAIICPEYSKDDKGRTRKKFIAFVELTNPQGVLKAQAELHYSAKPHELRTKDVDEIRQHAKEALRAAH